MTEEDQIQRGETSFAFAVSTVYRLAERGEVDHEGRHAVKGVLADDGGMARDEGHLVPRLITAHPLEADA